jgi:hypothetical protein
MIAQGLLPFKYEEERQGFGLTGLGGSADIPGFGGCLWNMGID